ncbi:MAG: restriction modification system specificity domain protein [Bacteroidetes bacterium]|nr:restriction modification system specificity domain protein [Bacteroidota bacterium]
MELKKGYKLTEVGVIPMDWEVKLVEDFAEVKSGKRLPLGHTLTNRETPHPYIRVVDMYQGGVSLDAIQYVPEYIYPVIKNYRIFKEDIFISVAGTLGVVGVIPENLNGANLTENANRFTNIKCDKTFLLYVLMSWIIQDRIEAERTMGAQPKLALTRIRRFEIPFPPTTSEQISIGKALLDIDSLINGIEKLIEKKKNIKQGAMQKLFHPKKGWEVKTLGDLIAEISDGGTPPTSSPNNFGGQINWVVIDDIKDEIYITKQTLTDEGFSKSSSRLWKPETIILSTGATIGEVGIAKIYTATKQGICGIVVKENVSNIFLKYWLVKNKNLLLSIAQGSSIKEVRPPTLIKFEINIPEYEEQIKIATILSDMDTEIAALETKLEKYKNVKTGMMQNLLTGKIRLV